MQTHQNYLIIKIKKISWKDLNKLEKIVNENKGRIIIKAIGGCGYGKEIFEGERLTEIIGEEKGFWPFDGQFYTDVEIYVKDIVDKRGYEKLSEAIYNALLIEK